MHWMRHCFFIVLFTIFAFINNAVAQSNGTDFFDSTGKIYVVVAVVTLIFVCLLYTSDAADE